jgi:hypothetical protein
MKETNKLYLSQRGLTILLTTVMLPFGTFVGFEFGAGHTRTALIALSVQTGLTLIQSTVWWFTIEKIRA